MEATYTQWVGAYKRGVKDVSSENVRQIYAYMAAMVTENLTRGNAKRRTCKLPEKIDFARPRLDDPLGCPAVSAKKLKKCVEKQRPCILKDKAHDFVDEKFRPLGSWDMWADRVGNGTVRVSYPYMSAEGMTGTLNNLVSSKEFLARPEVAEDLMQAREKPDANKHPWSLLRGPSWHMRFRDAVDMARYGPDVVYINQVMMCDLGPGAVEGFTTPPWVSDANLQLLMGHIWMNNQDAITGYHTDGPDNLLVQLKGEKELVLLRPSEVSHLYYDEVIDVQPRSELQTSGKLKVTGATTLDRRSNTHSVVNVANLTNAAEFPLYAQARGVSCNIGPGDVLYIPSNWHHAVATMPDKDCEATSLNFWYYRQGSHTKLEDAVKFWGGARKPKQQKKKSEPSAEL